MALVGRCSRALELSVSQSATQRASTCSDAARFVCSPASVTRVSGLGDAPLQLATRVADSPVQREQNSARDGEEDG